MLCDFHTHTFLSDGSLSPIELIRRASHVGYRAIALTDHAGIGFLDRVVHEAAAECALSRDHWPILAIPGVELTHLPPAAIAESARRAKEQGALLVVVHGETIVEPVEKGTNKAALLCPDVDILAHPGLITMEEAEIAASNGIYLEISSRRGHSLTNGHVARMAEATGARLLLNSDAHDVADLLTTDTARSIAAGAGLDETQIDRMLITNVQDLIKKLPLKS